MVLNSFVGRQGSEMMIIKLVYTDDLRLEPVGACKGGAVSLRHQIVRWWRLRIQSVPIWQVRHSLQDDEQKQACLHNAAERAYSSHLHTVSALLVAANGCCSPHEQRYQYFRREVSVPISVH